MAEPATGITAGADRGFGWRKLLAFAALAAALNILLATILIFKSADPPFLVMFVLFTAGGALALRSGKAGIAGRVMAVLAALMFAMAGGGFLFSLIQTPEAKEIIPVSAGFLLSVSVLISAVVLAIKGKGRTMEPSTGAKALGGLVVLLIVAVAAWNVYLMSTFESDAARAGDIRVVTEEFEFQPNSLTADSGTVSVHIENRDETLHTFTIERLGVDVSVPAGKSVRTTFQADGGEYKVICRPHAPDMDAQLTVS